MMPETTDDEDQTAVRDFGESEFDSRKKKFRDKKSNNKDSPTKSNPRRSNNNRPQTRITNGVKSVGGIHNNNSQRIDNPFMTSDPEDEDEEEKDNEETEEDDIIEEANNRKSHKSTFLGEISDDEDGSFQDENRAPPKSGNNKRAPKNPKGTTANGKSTGNGHQNATSKKKYSKTKRSPKHHFSRKSRQHFEQAKLWKRIGILDGKDKMVWARRAFFMSTERIFPGFTQNYGLISGRPRGRDSAAGIKLRSSIPLKMSLLAHTYFVPIWFVGFLLTQEYATRSLKPLHSYVLICITFISMGSDVLRLYAGFLSNAKDDMQLLALFWMATIILQTPMLGFIFATHCFSTSLLPLNVALDILLGSILLSQIWIGFWHLKTLVSSEINLLHMARQMEEVVMMDKDQSEGQNPKIVNCPEKGPYLSWTSNSEGEEGAGAEEDDKEEDDVQDSDDDHFDNPPHDEESPDENFRGANNTQRNKRNRNNRHAKVRTGKGKEREDDSMVDLA